MKKKIKKKYGIIIISLGIGILLTIFMPFWCWLLIVGAGLVCGGYYIIKKC